MQLSAHIIHNTPIERIHDTIIIYTGKRLYYTQVEKPFTPCKDNRARRTHTHARKDERRTDRKTIFFYRINKNKQKLKKVKNF